MKTCVKCKMSKTEAEFSRRGEFDLQSWCKECARENNRQKRRLLPPRPRKRPQPVEVIEQRKLVAKKMKRADRAKARAAREQRKLLELQEKQKGDRSGLLPLEGDMSTNWISVMDLPPSPWKIGEVSRCLHCYKNYLITNARYHSIYQLCAACYKTVTHTPNGEDLTFLYHKWWITLDNWDVPAIEWRRNLTLRHSTLADKAVKDFTED